MKAQIILLSSDAPEDELLRTEEHYVKRAMLFYFHDVEYAYRNNLGNIVVALQGIETEIAYDKELWNKLEILFS
jgi:hypothetical protein